MNSTRAGSILALAAGICACADDARAQGSVAQDRAALIAFYDVVDVQEWDDDENWASDAPLGKWSGVTTDESGRVTKLEVPTFWATRGQQDRVAGEAPAPLTVEILRNAEYQWVDWPTSLEPAPGGKAKLTDGRFVTLVPEARHVYYLELMDRVAFGDLNGDGIDDAVVFLRANGGGGNHEGLYLTAVVNEQGQPRHVDSRYLGDSRGGPSRWRSKTATSSCRSGLTDGPTRSAARLRKRPSCSSWPVTLCRSSTRRNLSKRAREQCS